MKIKENYNGGEFDFLIGKSIKKVTHRLSDDRWDKTDIYSLICDDGTIIEVETNAGCGGCSNGWSYFDDLAKLEECDNVITNIKVEYKNDDQFVMFVYYIDNKYIKLEGDDGWGNGYYGGGFYVTIKDVKEVQEDE